MHLRLLSLIAATAAGLVLVGIGGAHPSNLCTTSCITEYSLQSTGGGPFGVVAGRGGSVWYGHTNTVGRIAADGTETEFAVPTGNANVGVVARGDGDTVWFAERFGNKIGHIDAEGNVVEYPIPSAPPAGTQAARIPAFLRESRSLVTMRSGSRKNARTTSAASIHGMGR